MANDRRLMLTASLVLLFWFYLQGIRVLLSRMFGVVYDALFVGPFSAFAVVVLAAMFLSFMVPPVIAEISPSKWLWIFSGALLALIRIAMTAEDPSWRLYTGIAAAFVGTLVLSLAWRIFPEILPASMALSLSVDQLSRAVGDTLDPTMLSHWMPYQVVLSLAAIVLLVYAAGKTTTKDRGISPLGAVAMGSFLFLEVSLLNFPNALARWSTVDYTWAVPALMFVTILAAWRSPLEIGEVVLWRIFPGRMLMVIVPMLGVALGALYRGPIALFGLVVAQFWTVWILRYFIVSRNGSERYLSLGMFAFLILSFGYAFAFTYPYTLPFFKGAGLEVVLVATFLTFLPVFSWAAYVPSPAEAFGSRAWALLAFLLVASSTWFARPAPVKWSSRKTLRMGTYNIHYGYNAPWKFNLPSIAETIARSGADVIALQEVDTGRPTSYMVDDALYLGRKLGMDVIYLPTIEHLTGIALLSRFPMSEIRGTMLTSHLEQTGIIGARVTISGHDVHVYGIWLGLTRSERMRQIKEATHFIDAVPGPAALGGDFNSTPDSPVYTHMLSEGFLDPFAKLGKPQVLTDPAISPTERIDYVWFREIDPLEAEVMDSTASDHRMVVAEGKPR